jgi:hypothetical protein
MQGGKEDTQTYSLYFKCPITKQMRCPVNGYKKIGLRYDIYPAAL